MSPIEQNPSIGISEQIFKEFLEQLKGNGAPDSVIERMQKTFEDNSISETSIKKSLFFDDTEL